MKCPSCNCNCQGGDTLGISLCNSCGTSYGADGRVTRKKSFIKRTFAKYLLGRDKNGCEVEIDKGAGGMLVSDGIKTWFASGSNNDPIKIDNLQQLTDAFEMMGVTCDGAIGKITSENEEPRYLQISKQGLTTAADQNHNVLFDQSSIEGALNGTLAMWQCDGKNYRLSSLRAPDPNNNACVDERFYLTFSCKGDQEYREVISQMYDLIAGCTNEGSLMLYDGQDAYRMNMDELTACDMTRWFPVFVEDFAPDPDNEGCDDIQKLNRRWYKTREIILNDNDVDLMANDDYYITTLKKVGSGPCIKLGKIFLDEGEVLVGGPDGKIIRKTIEDIIGENFDTDSPTVGIGATHLFETPIVVATGIAAGNVDLTSDIPYPVPNCGANLFAIVSASLESKGNGKLASVTINGVLLVETGNSNSGSERETASGFGYVKIGTDMALRITWNPDTEDSPLGKSITPKVRLHGFVCSA